MQMKRYFSLIIFILIIVSISFSGCDLDSDSKKAFFNVATETRGSWISSGITHYFTMHMPYNFNYFCGVLQGYKKGRGDASRP